MSLQNDKKLMSLVDNLPKGMVATSTWLKEFGISRQLVQKYKQSGWISPIGRGAYKRTNEQVSVYGAVYALQKQCKFAVHIGATSALDQHGVSHYLRMNERTLFLFSDHQEKLPAWFRKYQWSEKPNHVTTNFLPRTVGITELEIDGFELKVSSTERAILEALYLTPKQLDLVEVYQIIEGLQTLRPSLVQELLENCKSIKVKRLFLYMAEKANLPVLKHLKMVKIHVGSGDRTIVAEGAYVSKYGLTLPEELVELTSSPHPTTRQASASTRQQ